MSIIYTHVPLKYKLSTKAYQITLQSCFLVHDFTPVSERLINSKQLFNLLDSDS